MQLKAIIRSLASIRPRDYYDLRTLWLIRGAAGGAAVKRRLLTNPYLRAGFSVDR
ncbi:hypothetical protein HMPREF1248_0516 [Coriobacteriaceae bacterium BV3Ac1]|nr:hypothetical protein HMPREF1248_0516 [Coriobacteriaceae bacterium BV3Ac1]